MARVRQLDLTARRRSNGDQAARTTRLADPDDIGLLQQTLHDMLAAEHWDEGRHGEFDLEVREAGERAILHTVNLRGLVRT